MSEKVIFSAFDPVRFDTPSRCDVCLATPPVFHYEYNVDESVRHPVRKGFCCAACSTKLLEKLQRAESRVWAEEEAALEADDIEVSAKPHLATVGTGRN